jgi:hypothetical protein
MYMCRSGDVEMPSDGLPSPSANVAAVALPGTREQAQLRFTQTNMKDLVSVDADAGGCATVARLNM